MISDSPIKFVWGQLVIQPARVVWPWNKQYVLQDIAQVSVGGNLQLVSSRLAFSHQENLQFAQAFPAKQVDVLNILGYLYKLS